MVDGVGDGRLGSGEVNRGLSGCRRTGDVNGSVTGGNGRVDRWVVGAESVRRHRERVGRSALGEDSLVLELDNRAVQVLDLAGVDREGRPVAVFGPTDDQAFESEQRIERSSDIVSVITEGNNDLAEAVDVERDRGAVCRGDGCSVVAEVSVLSDEHARDVESGLRAAERDRPFDHAGVVVTDFDNRDAREAEELVEGLSKLVCGGLEGDRNRGAVIFSVDAERRIAATMLGTEVLAAKALDRDQERAAECGRRDGLDLGDGLGAAIALGRSLDLGRVVEVRTQAGIVAVPGQLAKVATCLESDELDPVRNPAGRAL